MRSVRPWWRAWVVLVLAGHVASGAIPGEASFHAVPQVRFGRVAQAPAIDGVLDDPCWQSPPQITAFHHLQSGQDAALPTAVLGGFDAENLYLAFRCQEPKAADLGTAALPHDNMALFAADHIEVFLQTDPLADAYYQFAVHTSGSTYESQVTDAAWNADWRAAAKVGADQWVAELAIPLTAIKATGARFIQGNFCRTRRLTPPETTCWSTTFGVFHNPARFGAVVLGDELAVQIGTGRLTTQPDRNSRLSVTVQSLAAPPGAVALSLAMKDKGAFVEAGRNALTLVPNQTAEAVFTLRPEEAYSGPLVLIARDAAGAVAYCRGPQEFSLRGTRGLRLARALPDAVAPGLRWLETERLRGCSYGGKADAPPALALTALDPTAPAATPPEPLALCGETVVRVLATPTEPLAFVLAGGATAAAFPRTTYAVFAPNGTPLAEGEVAAGDTRAVEVPAAAAGLHVLWINSGPASENAFTLALRNRHWVLDGRGKGAYVDTRCMTNSVRDLALSGFNTLLLAAWSWGVDFSTDAGLAEWLRLIEPWAAAADRSGMRYIPYLGWGCGKADVDAAGDYRRNVSLREIDGPRPCPLSEEYWERSFMRRALAVAELSKTHPSIVGIGLDPESYYFNSWYQAEYRKRALAEKSWSSVTFFSEDECFCDHCFGGFLAARGLAKPAVAANGKARLDWLRGQGLQDAYYRYLEDELAKLTRQVVTRLQEVKPDFMVAVMLLGASDTWWCRGASRGLGTPRVPVLEFDETTYTPGYTPQSEAHVARFRKWGAHVFHGGALWACKHRPDEPGFLSAQMYHFAVRDGGYWIWPGSASLWRNPNQNRHYYILSGYQEDYWKSFVRANHELDRKLSAGDAAPSPLDVLEPPTPVLRNPDLVREPNEWGLKPFYPLRLASGTALAFHVPKGTTRMTLRWGNREPSGRWQLCVSSGQRSTTVPSDLTANAGSEKVFEVGADEAGGVWTVKVEAATQGAGTAYLGLGIDGVPPFFSLTPAALLVGTAP